MHRVRLQSSRDNLTMSALQKSLTVMNQTFASRYQSKMAMPGAVLRTGNLQNEADLNRGLREAQIHVPRRRPDAAMVEDR